MFGGRRRPVERRRPTEVRHLEGAAILDGPDWEPGWDRSPLFGEPPPLSLPDMRPGRERLTALSLSERLLQERDALLSQLTGLEQVAVRSQLHAATLQSRLHRVLAVNDALDRELRLAGGQRLLPGSPASVSAVSAEDRMARSTPDLRPPSRIPQLVVPRRRPAGTERSPHRAAGGDRSLQLAVRPRTPVGRPRSPHRQERSLHWQERSPHRPAGRDRSLQSARRPRSPAGRPRSRSRETQTLASAMPGNTPQLVDRSMNATESTTRVVDSATSIGICTASVGTSTSLLYRSPACDGPTSCESRTSRRDRDDRHRDLSAGPRGIRAPDRSRVTAILSETSPLKLQKELLTLLVEAETLRAQVDSMGRGWVGRRPRSEGCEPLQQQASSQADSDDIRLQLEMRNIELEGTRARLRQLEAAWATRPALGGGGGGRSVSPRPAVRQPDGRPVCQPDRRPVTAVRPEPQRASPAVRTERRPLTPGRPPPPAAPAQGGSGRLPGRPEVTLPGRRGPSPAAVPASGPRSGGGPAQNPTKPAASGPGTAGPRTQAGPAGPSRSPAGPRPSLSPSPSTGGPGRPAAAGGRRVADLVRGWTEAGESRTGVPASSGTGSDPPDQKDKVRRRLSSETSAKIPATQSQALGQILTALSRGHSPRAVPRRPAGPDPALELRSPEVRAEVRRLREATAQRLRQARLETSDGEVADSLTSATASEDGGDASLEERLKLIEDGGRTGGGGGFRYGEGLVLSAGEGLLQRILGGRDSAQRLKPRPAGE